MYQLTVGYPHPTDPNAFLEHYRTTHTPIDVLASPAGEPASADLATFAGAGADIETGEIVAEV